MSPDDYADDQEPSCDGMDEYRWTWTAFAVQLTKPAVGLAIAATSVTQSILHMLGGMHDDLTAHHNWKIGQNIFRDEVTRDLESIF